MLDLEKRKIQIENLSTEEKQQALKIIAAVSLLIESEVVDPNLAIEGIELDEKFDERPYGITAKKTAYGNYLVVENFGESLMRLEMLGGALVSVTGITNADIAYWEKIHHFDYDLNDLNDNAFFNL